MSTEPVPKVHRGLKDVYFERSAVTLIDGKAGGLRYRGYSIHDLPRNSTLEETAYLLLHNELEAQLVQFDRTLKAARQLPPAILDIIAAVRTAHPMEVLRTAVSALCAFDPEVGDNSHAATLRKGLRLTAQVPMIVAAHERIRKGKTPLAPDADLGHAANFLWMLAGQKPFTH
jgi:citrate synthase